MAKVWRPTKYRKQYVEWILDFFTERSKVLYEEKNKRIKNSTNKFWESNEKEIFLFPTDFPTFQEYAQIIWVDDITLFDWTKQINEDWALRYPEFSISYNKCKNIQKKCLLINWLNWLYQSNFAWLVIRNFFPDEFKEKTEVDLWWQKENPIKIDYKDPKTMNVEELDLALNELISHNKK
jgi:hypothetical protein